MGGTVTFRLELPKKRKLLQDCSASPELPFDYVAVIHDLKPGTYLLRIEHSGADRGDGLQLEKEVVVR